MEITQKRVWIGSQTPAGLESPGPIRPRMSIGYADPFHIEHTLARQGAERLWNLLHTESYVPALGAMTGNQAVQQVDAGLKAIYVSGWQVAADANDAGQMYPDQSLYPADSVPNLCAASTSADARRPDSSLPKARTASTGSLRSSPTPKRDSAAPSMRSN